MAVKMNLISEYISDLLVCVCNFFTSQAYRGEAWLFLGVANTDALLYDEDWKKIVSQYPSNFRYDTIRCHGMT